MLNLTRQSVFASSPVKLAEAATMLDIASPPTGKLILRIALKSPAGLDKLLTAAPIFDAAFNPLLTTPAAERIVLAAVDNPDATSKLIFWSPNSNI
jgi:hypothetical protein